MNEDIRYDHIRLIGSDGEQLGVISSRDALEKAYEEGLDLVEVSGNSDPPVCRIMNYDKYRYEQSKKQAEARKRQTVVEVKEVKFRPKTEEHDLNFKIKNIKKFLANKNKVKITLRFRGREIVYAQSQGVEVLNKIAEALAEEATIVQQPTMEGRQMVMFVAPKS
ncbi:MAG: translation initiation factor IF-3 [Deltaproteobacteria bacterium]|jgi:translation initiation factor IF-3|nr:MAG: translation initiation factor IF-3 [Deltaproteobacteria bacterium]